MKQQRTPISTFLPPFIADALVAAAARHDDVSIDRITDQAVRQYPELVVPRHTVREEFMPKDRLQMAKDGV